MQTELNKSKKIILDTRHENKANKTGFAILPLPAKSSTLNHFRTEQRETH